ncbi:ATP-binding protein [Streptomyces specialis]|uniref:ATP-binding protein n=1 Tax=Streptomyces specialis TaxID=498367 RepID=UPI001F43684B|nr:ATP-binding protein [Streptomyces specialis]
MLCQAESLAEARAFVRVVISAWGLDDLCDDGALLVSELVANAVRHTPSRVLRVTVTRVGGNVVRIAVVDKSRVLPVRRCPGGGDVCGRGLLIVEALTTRWGADLLASGKRVWGEVAR